MSSLAATLRSCCLVGCLGALSTLLGGCLGGMPVPLTGLNRQLQLAGANNEPSLSGRWLALINGRGAREQVLLLDLDRQAPVPLPGLNRGDAQPISVSVDSSGERLAVVRQRAGATELVLYRRSLMSLQPIPMEPAAVPRRVNLRADGRQLAVEVSRDGLWQIDLVELP